ncbi:MAG: hypothetical protein B6U94_05765 [Thermofilum sp. ex4484_79]|nr:MAG: hypothetical protein B6U94_05765 [Thermofilum sp. ex4484_79]
MRFSQDKVVYLSSVGLQPVVIVNSIWMFSKRYGCPDVIYVFPTRETEKFIESIIEAVKCICRNIKVEKRLVNDIDISRLIRDFSDVIRECKEKGYKTVVDVTAGRKTMSIALYSAAVQTGVDAIIYVHLKDAYYLGYVLPLIPRSLISLVVLNGED